MNHRPPEPRPQTFRAASHRHGPHATDVWLQVVDGGLAGVIFLVPLVMGGRHPLGQLVLVFLAVATSLAWVVRQWRSKKPKWRPTWTPLLLIAGAALALLQVVPLPAVVLHWLDPRLVDVLPLWHSAGSSAGGLGTWPCISMTPADTSIGLVLFLAYGLLFGVVVQRIDEVDDVERMLRWCGLAALGMAVFALLQFFANNGKFFWFYQHPLTNTAQAIKGSFSNRNHFAHFLALGMGPLIWWLQDTARRTQDRLPATAALAGEAHRHELHMYLLGLAMALVVFANLLSLSRGGIMAALIACTVCTTVCYRASAVGGKLLAGLAAASLTIGLALAVFGFDRLAERLDGFLTGSLEKLDYGRGRRDIWAAAVQAIPDHAIVGAGVGSFQEVYPTYGNPGANWGIEYTHAESGPLQVAVEMGGVGLALVLAGIACGACWCLRGCSVAAPARLRLCAGAIAASLAAFVAHGVVDFVWYVPACAAQVAILAACALRISQWTRQPSAKRKPAALPHWAAAAATLALLSLGTWMIATCVGPAMAAPYWDQYLLALDASQAELGTADHREAGPAGAENLEREREMIATLENVVEWQPAHFRAQLALSELHLRQFEQLQTRGVNPMSFVNVRDAVLQSRFPSPEAMVTWLSRAVGDHWTHLERALYHARQSFMSCPLEGRAYIYLAELDFLDHCGGLSMQNCLNQALRVRPFDGAVLYAAASEACLAGDSSKWLEYAKQAFHCGPEYQRRLIVDLMRHTAPEGTPAMVAFLLREFQPDLDGIRSLDAVCARQCRPEQLVPIRRCWAEMAENEARKMKEPESVAPWIESLHVYLQLNEPTHALDCGRHAVKSDPNNYQAHYELASCLIEQKDFAEAETHLHWCLQRLPGDPAAEAKLKQALQGRLDSERRAAMGTEHWR